MHIMTVDIFEKPQNVLCIQKLLVSALENHKAQLDQEMMMYSRKLKYVLSTEEERQKGLDKDKTCPPVIPGGCNSKGILEHSPLNLTTPFDLIDQHHEEVYDALTRDRVSEVETTNREMQKALLQVSSVFREEPEDSDIIPRVLSQLKVEERSESPCLEMRKRKKAKKLGSKQPECHPHKSQLVKPRVENRKKLMCLKKDVSFEELEHKIEKLATQTNNTCAEIFEIRKGNKTMRKKFDKILSILDNEKGEKETQDDNGFTSFIT